MILDPWQKEFIEHKGNKVLVSGRQTGKSEAAAVDNGEFVAKNPGETALIISKTERQADELLLKTLRYVGDNYKNMIRKGAHKPIKSKFELTNGSRVISLPVGLGGEGVRYLTIGKLTVDEAQLPPDDVYDAVTPMLLTTGGSISLLGTPQGKRGYFWKAFENKLGLFKVFHINSEEVIKNRPINETWPEWRRTAALNHLAQEKQRMSQIKYRQEYMGEFLDELMQLFPTGLIKACMTLTRGSSLPSRGDNFLGVDVARMGEDESVLFSVSRINRERLRQIDLEVTTKTYLTDTIARIKASDLKYNFKKIYIDDGGMGVGVFDPLLQDGQTKRKVIAINNSSRSLDVQETPQKKRLMKEDLYANLKWLMEQGKIEIFNEPNIEMSLQSVQYEYTEGKIKIFGNYTHIAEALVRAAWCMRDRSLGIWAR